MTDALVTDQPDACARVRVGTSLEQRGTLTRLAGLVLEASGLRIPVGSQCHIRSPSLPPVLAEVVGFSQDRAYLMPAGDVHGLTSGASVVPAAAFVPVPRLGHATHQDSDLDVGRLRLPLGQGLLDRVVDAHGAPMDRMGPILDVAPVALDRSPVNAMDRAPIREVLDTGIRAGP